MVCLGMIEAMGSLSSWADWIVYPTTCYYYFYALIFFVLFGILMFALFNREREELAKPDLISSAGVSATAIMFLASIATLIKSTSGIPMLQTDIFVYIIAMWIVLAGLWFFKPANT